MADAFHRNTGEQAAYGYRQLPGAGPAGGPELKTMVFGTIGVALGIVVGTLLADGSLRSMSPFASHQPVRAGASASAVAGRPSTQPGQAGPSVHQAVAQGSTQLPATQKPPAVATSTVAANSNVNKPFDAASISPSAPTSTANTAKLPPLAATITVKTLAQTKTSPAVQASAESKTSTSANTSVLQRVSAAHKRRLARRMAARLKWAAWRKLHPRHKLHGHLIAAIPVKPADIVAKPKPVEAPKPVEFSFMVEGSVSVANYDAATGMIDTYEGETFALDRRASEGRTIAWLEYPAEVQYRCDQFWNCTLIHAGISVVSAKRTK